MPELIYLACPYSDPDPMVMQERFETVTKVAAVLMVETACEVFSPITHSHMISMFAMDYAQSKDAVARSAMGAGCAKWVKAWLPTYDFWLRFDFHMLDIADWLYVLKLPGWGASMGVGRELNRFMLRLRRRIKYIDKEEYIG
jgi:hypothetical protein